MNFLLRATFCFSAERKKLETAVLYTEVRYLMNDFLLMMGSFQVNNNDNMNGDKDTVSFYITHTGEVTCPQKTCSEERKILPEVFMIKRVWE